MVFGVRPKLDLDKEDVATVVRMRKNAVTATLVGAVVLVAGWLHRDRAWGAFAFGLGLFITFILAASSINLTRHLARRRERN